MCSRRTSGDAEVRLMRGDMMDAVVLAGQDDLAVLQEHHPAGKAEVRVRPLMNLIGQSHENGQCKQVAVPRIVMVNLRWKETERRCIFVLFILVSCLWRIIFKETHWFRLQLLQGGNNVTFVDTKLTRGEGEKVEGHVCKREKSQHAVIPIGLDEVMARDGRGVDVVLPEGAYESLQESICIGEVESLSKAWRFNVQSTPGIW